MRKQLWNPRAQPWWNAPVEQMFEAYYMTLRMHYDMPALQAYQYAKQHGASIGVGRPGGFIGLLREALREQ